VSFDPAKRVEGASNYNFGTSAFGGEEAPGVSVFRRGEDGAVYHTYSTYGRGLEMVNGTYHMPEGVLPQGYGIDDTAMPEGLMPQLVYPLLQKA